MCNQGAQKGLLTFGVLKYDLGIVGRTPQKVGRKNHGQVANTHFCVLLVLWPSNDLHTIIKLVSLS